MNGMFIKFVPVGYTEGTNDTSSHPSLLANQTRSPLGYTDPNIIVLRYIIEVWLCTPITVLGVLGNLVSLVVLHYMRKSKHRAVTTMLQALAISDTLVLLSGFWLRTMRYLTGEWYVYYHAITFPVFFSTNYVLRLINTWLTVLLTFDRYVAVCHPLHAQSFCTTKKTYVQIVCVVVASFAFCVPRYFEATLEYNPNPQYTTTALMKNRLYAVVYRILLFLFVQYILPMVILIALNGRVVWSLRFSPNQPRFTLNRPKGCNVSSLENTHCLLQALVASTTRNARKLATTQDASAAGKPNATRDDSARISAITNHTTARKTATTHDAATKTTHNASARTLTRIVLVVVLLCTFCHVVSMVSHVLLSVQTAFYQLPGIDLCRRYFSNISNLLMTFNSAVNFLIYCALSRNFRAILDHCLADVFRRGRHFRHSGRRLYNRRRFRSAITAGSGTRRGANSSGQSVSTQLSMTMISVKRSKSYDEIQKTSAPSRDVKL